MAHDTDKVAYDDEDILLCINGGLRFVRRAIIKSRPEILASEEQHGVLRPGEYRIDFAKRPLKIYQVRVGDEVKSSTERYTNAKVYHNRARVWHNQTRICSLWLDVRRHIRVLPEANSFEIQNLEGGTGRPAVYYRTGMSGIAVYPVPEKETEWRVSSVDDIEELTLKDVSPLLNEYDDFIVEYAIIRLSVGNEYNVAQETQLMANVSEQLNMFLSAPPRGVTINSYWDDATCNSVASGW